MKLLKSKVKGVIINQLSCIIYIGENLKFNEFKNMSKDWSEMNVYKSGKYFLVRLLCRLKSMFKLNRLNSIAWTRLLGLDCWKQVALATSSKECNMGYT